MADYASNKLSFSQRSLLDRFVRANEITSASQLTTQQVNELQQLGRVSNILELVQEYILTHQITRQQSYGKSK